MLHDIWRHRELSWILFQRDLKAQFRQSALGYLWLVIPPLANAVVWYFLNSQKLINVNTGAVPYPVFVLIGSTLWTAFCATLNAPSETIASNREVLVKLNVPVESFILAGSARAVFNLIVTSLILLPVLLLQGVRLQWSALMFPLSAFAFLTTAFAMGMSLAPLGALYTDVRNAIGPFLALLMFSTPVVFPIPESSGLIATVMRWNPLTPALSLSRDNLVSGSLEWLIPSLVWLAISLLVLLVTFVGLRVAKPHLIARMGM
jgi:lipopolysaccharide transport system permease protein